MTFEPPLEGGGDLLVAILKPQQAVLEFVEGREVIGRQDLSLHDGEIDFHLIEPTGVDRSVDWTERRPLRAEASDGLLTAMARTIVHNPEDAVRRTIGLLTHNLGDQAIERGDTGFLLTAAEDLGSAHVPSRQISPSAFPLVLMFDIAGAAGGRRQARVPSAAGLDAGFLIGAQNVVVGGQRKALPGAGIEVENRSGLVDKGRIARKNPVAETPGAQRVAAQPAPQGGTADLGHDALGQDFAANLGQGEARQRESKTRRKLAGQGLNLDDDAGGKSGPVARPEVPLRGRANAPGRNACATY
jgi:hypothetical protein